MIDWMDENTSTHNHYKLSVDFIRTEFFKEILDNTNFNNLKELTLREVQNDLKDKLAELLLRIESINPQDLTLEFLSPILKNFAKHIIGNEYQEHNVFRFNANPFLDSNRVFQHMEIAFEQCNQINKFKDDPENGNLNFKSWNKEMMGSIWACVYGGLIDEGLYLIETLENLIYRIQKNKPKNCVFKTVLDQPTPGRFLMSLYMAKARLYLQTGDKSKAIECFEFITSMFKSESENKKYYIYWFTGLNRVLEAAIEVYKLNPTKENKKRCFDFYIKSALIDPQGIEPTETVREKGIITYMFVKHVLGIELK